MGEAKRRRESHAMAPIDTLNVAARVSQAIHIGAEVLGDAFGHAAPASLSASVFDMVVDRLDVDGIDGVIRTAAKRLDDILGGERNHLGVVVQVYNDGLPDGMPMASAVAENGDELPPSPLTHPDHYVRVELAEVPLDQRDDIAKGVSTLEDGGMGPVGIYRDRAGGFHFFAVPAGQVV